MRACIGVILEYCILIVDSTYNPIIMPNLKSALLNAQHASAQKAAKAKHEQAKLLKQKSITGANKSQHAAGKRKAAMNTDALGRIVKEKKLPTSTGQVSRAPPVLPYDKDDTILLIGEGNFSYTLSLLSPPHSHPAHLVLATAYDTEAVCYEKYPDAAEHVKQIKERGAGVEFGVDAAQLGRCKAIGKQPRWSRIVFNFPHAGE
jgi:25S rRNA (uracil2634-N3)-methyltransferase